MSSTTPIPCGKEAATHFAFAENYKNLNHGSYGTHPTAIRTIRHHYLDQAEAKPDDFVRYQYRTHLLEHSRQTLAEYLDVEADNVVLVPNATTGVETVLRNLVFKEGDVVVCFPDTYPAFANALHYLSTTTPLSIHKIDYTHPVDDDFICTAFETALQHLRTAGKTPRLALFDTVSSLPGVRMPFERLTQLCRAQGVLSLIDGAHGVGQISLHLRQLDADFFVSNLHKWLFVPRGCAVMYIPPRNQHLLKTTLPTGFGYGEGFVKNFADAGTVDHTPYLCIPAALEWRRRVVWGTKRGEEAVEGYLLHLAREGGRRVAAILETEVLGSGGGCGMVNVRLPVSVGGKEEGERLVGWVMREMIVGGGRGVCVFWYKGGLWVRLSAQVYLTVEDFEEVGEVLRRVCGRVGTSTTVPN